MTTETYTLNGQTDFEFNHPVRLGTELTVEVVPGGVVSPASYEVIGAGPGATGVTVRYPTAPADGTKTLKITRQVELQRLSDFTGAAGINATGLEKELNNIYRALRDLVLRQTLKAPVKVATDANITLSGEQTVNGVSVTDGDRVLVTSQTDDTENGIYNVSTAAWTRTPDADDAEDIVNGTLVLDENSGNLYTFEFSGDFDPGTTSVTFTSTDFDLILADARAARDKAEEWAGNPEDVEVEPGEYSAFHWVQKAEEWAENPEDAEVEPGKYSAFHWVQKAEEWAENPEGVEVEPGEYSAFHWAQQAAEIVNGDRAVAAAVASGTDTLTASFGLTQYISTDVFAIQVQNTNTGAVTLNLDSLGAKNVTLSDGTALPTGSLEAGKVYSLWYDGSKFIVLNPSVSQAVAEAGTQGEGVMTPERVKQVTMPQPPTSEAPAGDTIPEWEVPNADRPVLVTVTASAVTNGSTPGRMSFTFSEDADGAADFNVLFAVAEPSLGAGAEVWGSFTTILPPGAGFGVVNTTNPSSGNQVRQVIKVVL